MMIKFSEEYGDIDEAFYNSLESDFEQACKLISKEQLKSYFRKDCQDLISRTYGFGWGVYDGLKDAYQE